MKPEQTMSQLDRSYHSSGNRRSTRSQAAPNWNPTDELILVNEVAAIEGNCLKALSSFQKWKIIAHNCSALGVSRTLNQYRELLIQAVGGEVPSFRFILGFRN
ncbi:hypothetical protein ACFX1Z_000368 [Malus domestica]